MDRDEILRAIQAIKDGFDASMADGIIVVDNPDATPEALALGGVNPKLVIDLDVVATHLGDRGIGFAV